MTTSKQPELSVAVVEQTDTAVEVFNPQAVADALRESLQGEQITAWDFDRVKVPAGGGTTWTIPTIEGEQEVKAFTGVIAYTQVRRSFWARGLEESGGGSPPDCSSTDAMIGRGIRWDEDTNEPHDCSTCRWAMFGSDARGVGQACKQARFLFIQREGAFLPLLLSVPPSSLKSVKQYLLQLAGRGKSASDAVTRFELVKTKNAGGIAYAQIMCKLDRFCTPEEAAQAKATGAVLRGVLDTIAYMPDAYTE